MRIYKQIDRLSVSFNPICRARHQVEVSCVCVDPSMPSDGKLRISLEEARDLRCLLDRVIGSAEQLP